MNFGTFHGMAQIRGVLEHTADSFALFSRGACMSDVTKTSIFGTVNRVFQMCSNNPKFARRGGRSRLGRPPKDHRISARCKRLGDSARQAASPLAPGQRRSGKMLVISSTDNRRFPDSVAMPTPFCKLQACAAAAVTLAIAVASASAGPFSSMVVFGDSLSDVGNIADATVSPIRGGTIPTIDSPMDRCGLRSLSVDLGLGTVQRSLAGGMTSPMAGPRRPVPAV